MDVKEIGVNTRDWIVLAQDRDDLESPCECGTETPGPVSLEIS
jgi:hypothetical protein